MTREDRNHLARCARQNCPRCRPLEREHRWAQRLLLKMTPVWLAVGAGLIALMLCSRG